MGNTNLAALYTIHLQFKTHVILYNDENS